MYTKTFRTSLKDMLDFAYGSATGKSVLLMILTGIPCFVVTTISNLVHGGPVYLYLAFLAVLVIFTVIPYYSVNKSLKHNILFKSDMTIVVSEESFIQQTEQSRAEIKWEDFYNCEITRRSYFLYLTSQQAAVIPKRIFKDEENIAITEIIKKRCRKRSGALRIAIAVVIALMFMFAAIMNGFLIF